VRTRHRAPVQQGSRAAACLLGLPGERSHRPSTAAGAAAEGLARSHRRPPLHVRMPGLMAICLYGMTLTAHTRRLCLPRATPRPTRGGLHRRVCIFTAISQGPPTYHAWICSLKRVRVFYCVFLLRIFTAYFTKYFTCMNSRKMRARINLIYTGICLRNNLFERAGRGAGAATMPRSPRYRRGLSHETSAGRRWKNLT